ncbi:MAG: type II secretion system minor pseudopilin GspK, partial [Burkholderiales bacterium]
MTRARQRGVAIVLAMGVMALAALAAGAMLISQSTWSREVELNGDHVQAQTLVRAGVDWARAVLSDDRRMGNVDYLGEPWALKLPPMPVDNGELAGHLTDSQGRFNLNNLAAGGKIDVVQLEHFRRLLAILELPPELADTLADWIDADGVPQPNDGAEDSYYTSLQPPYLTANRPLTDVAELALVRGFDEGVRAQLAPFVSALPRFTPVNVNTAPPEVLAAIVDGLDLDAARALVAQRERVYFRTVSDFTSALPSGATSSSRDVSVASDFFDATVRVSMGGAQARGLALLDRAGPGWPAIVWSKVL